jgi:hypothetical protein
MDEQAPSNLEPWSELDDLDILGETSEEEDSRRYAMHPDELSARKVTTKRVAGTTSKTDEGSSVVLKLPLLPQSNGTGTCA